MKKYGGREYTFSHISAYFFYYSRFLSNMQIDFIIFALRTLSFFCLCLKCLFYYMTQFSENYLLYYFLYIFLCIYFIVFYS